MRSLVEVIVAAMAAALALDFATPVHAFMQYADHDHSVCLLAVEHQMPTYPQAAKARVAVPNRGKPVGMASNAFEPVRNGRPVAGGQVTSPVPPAL